MKMDMWLGYQFSSAELCVLFDFSGERLIPGLPNFSPSMEEMEKACDSLLEKGMIFQVGGELLLEQTIKGLIHEMACSEAAMILDNRRQITVVYKGEKCWVLLAQAALKGWRLLALQTEEEAFEFAESFVEAMDGHLRISVVAGAEKKLSQRPGPDWKNVFSDLWMYNM